jgi:hypothetical protein
MGAANTCPDAVASQFRQVLVTGLLAWTGPVAAARWPIRVSSGPRTLDSCRGQVLVIRREHLAQARPFFFKFQKLIASTPPTGTMAGTGHIRIDG